MKGDVDLVNRLLACGADPNLKGGYYGVGASCLCLGKARIEVRSDFCWNMGADPDIQNQIGWTPLHYGVSLGSCHNGGETVLQFAQRREKQDVVDMLTRRGITE
ncbi:hypothetical protein FA13DRAFT_1738455 [Coprinellus micaceus]|uniref:Uncharacterized protein n=1 Tax=Coprinellus micaceus TaxID=71717 RepID=A0A4Y7STW0_COPMI|nr:hypothetical protein FA13DRAFT_1738455 [Coprinellus micaceus]